MNDCTCDQCCETLERVRFFPRQLIKAEDMRAEQEFHLRKLRRHNRHLHGWGVACGMQVVPPGSSDPPWQVTICPGYVVTPQGDDVECCDMVAFDVSLGAQRPEPCCEPWPCPPSGQMPGRDTRPIVFIAVRYAECQSRPVHVHPAGCGCDETGCEYSRIRESFELKALWQIPQSHLIAYEREIEWRNLIGAWAAEGNTSMTIGVPSATIPALAGASAALSPTAMFSGTVSADGQHPRVRPLPAPPCPQCTSEPWVVLAAIQLPDEKAKPITQSDISYVPRRVLWGVGDLMSLCQFTS